MLSLGGLISYHQSVPVSSCTLKALSMTKSVVDVLSSQTYPCYHTYFNITPTEATVY